MNQYEEAAKSVLIERKNKIVFIPNGIKILPEFLGSLSNDQFVETFRELQKILFRMYNDMERAPFEWGFPDFQKNKEYTDYGRAYGILVELIKNGICQDGILKVNVESYLRKIKKHKKWELMIIGFERLGFTIEKFDKKSESFNVTYPQNPYIITVFDAYVKILETRPCHWSMGIYRDSLSYRYVEVPQKYNAHFLALMDASSDEIREVQYWLYNETVKYGYAIDDNEPAQQGCVLYKKGSKRFLLVGETNVDGTAIERGKVSAKVTFRKIFKIAPEKFHLLAKKFPNVFKTNCRKCRDYDDFCQWRIPYEVNGEPQWNCTYTSFVFRNMTLDDVKDVFELFIIENNIKQST